MTFRKSFPLFAILLIAAVAVADVPQLINLQGVLKDPGGTPVPDGSYSVTFKIYDVPTGGLAIWTETQTVSTSNGLFTVLLGSSTPVPESLFYNPSRWLGITVGADPEMSPRQQFSSTGYSFVSSQWTSAGENLFRLNGNVGIGTTSPLTRLHVNGDNLTVGDEADITRGIIFRRNGAEVGRITTSTGQMAFQNSSSGDLNMVISSNGNVGIGTTSPGNKLDVIGGAAFQGNHLYIRNPSAPSGKQTWGFVVNSSTGNFAFGQTSDVPPSGGSLTNAPLRIEAGAPDQTIFVESSGNVGIGTSSPDAKFSIVSDTFKTRTLTSWSAPAWYDSSIKLTVASLTSAYDLGATAGVFSLARAGTNSVVIRANDCSSCGGSFSCFDAGSISIYKAGQERAGFGWDDNCLDQSIVFADVKNFKMPSPSEQGKEIWYATLEGPEAAAYLWGTARLVNGEATILLPQHYVDVASPKGLTIQLTPLSSDSRGLAVIKKSLDGVVIKEMFSGKNNYDFDYLIIAVRKGYEDYQVLRPASKYGAIEVDEKQ